MDLWRPDDVTFKKIQKLKEFADFLSRLEFATDEDKVKINEIKGFIEDIPYTKPKKEWCLRLEIFDYTIERGNEGIFWKYWSVYFEMDSLEITAETRHSEEHYGHYGDSFCFYGKVYFQKDFGGERVYLTGSINDFIEDAKKYKEYITETLNDIEVGIDIWQKNI